MARRATLRRRSALALLACLVGLVGLVPAALAQDGADARLVIREVDATDPAALLVTFAYDGDRAAVGGLTVRADGEQVETEPAVPLSGSRALGIALAVDTSGAMNDEAAIERAREAALAAVDGKADQDRMAVVGFGGEVVLLQDFTTDAALLEQAIANLAPSGDTTLLDGIVRTAALFRATTFQPNIIVISGGADDGSTASVDQATGALANAGAALFAVTLEGDSTAAPALERMADASGGAVFEAETAAEIGPLVTGIQESLADQYVVTVPASVAEGSSTVTLTIGAEQATAEYTAGARQEGSGALQPAPLAEPSGPAFLRSTAGLVLALVLVLAAVGLAVFSLGSTFFGRENDLDSVLRPYDEGFVAEEEDAPGRQQLAQTQLLQRAVEITGQFAEKRGILEAIEVRLERANVPLRPPEALFFYVVTVAVVTALGAAATTSLLGAVIVAVVAAIVPPAVLNFLAARRRKQFESLLPDTLQLLSSTLRAGYSLMQGVEAVAQEVAEPMGRELRRVVTEARLGRPLEESLNAVADRMESGDFAWAVMAIGIQREVGGNLSELLLTVAETMTERERLRRDVNALTAEGRVSAMVLGMLPVGLALFISGANPGYLDPLFSTTLGNILVGGALVLALAGFYWMKKIIEIEI